MGKSTISMAIFNSYVSSPEGNPIVSIAMSVHFSHEVCLLCTRQEEISDVRRSPSHWGSGPLGLKQHGRRIKALVDRPLQYHIGCMTRLKSYIYIYDLIIHYMIHLSHIYIYIYRYALFFKHILHNISYIINTPYGFGDLHIPSQEVWSYIPGGFRFVMGDP